MKLWPLIGLIALTACKPTPVALDTYYLTINSVHLRIPGKYVSFFHSGVIASKGSGCQHDVVACAQKPPGLNIDAISFMEQNFHTFERYNSSTKGPSDTLRIDIFVPEFPTPYKLPNAAVAWKSKNRDASNDQFDLKAYKALNRDDVNYQYEFANGEILYMTCKNSDMPNPGCEASTSWHGLLLRYDFRHRHLAEWRNLHQRLNDHFNSLIYQP